MEDGGVGFGAAEGEQAGVVAVGIAGGEGRPGVVRDVEATFVPAEGVHLLLGGWMVEQRPGDDPDPGRCCNTDKWMAYLGRRFLTNGAGFDQIQPWRVKLIACIALRVPAIRKMDGLVLASLSVAEENFCGVLELLAVA